MPVLRRRRSCGCIGDRNNNQLKAEVVIAMATATATAGGGSDDDDYAMPDAKGGGAEVGSSRLGREWQVGPADRWGEEGRTMRRGGTLSSFLIELLDNVGQGLVFESNK